MKHERAAVSLPVLPDEHFRCRARGETLTRRACAGHYARVAVSGIAWHDDKHCSGCSIGATHSGGRVPTHAASTVPAPAVEPSPKASSDDEAQRAIDRDKRRSVPCEDCGEDIPCKPMGRTPKKCHRCKSGTGVRPSRPTYGHTKPKAPNSAPPPEPPARSPGRPAGTPGGDTSGRVVSVLTSPEERAAIDAAAACHGLTTSQWARAVLVGAAAITGDMR